MPRSWGILPLSLHSFRDCFLYENDELPFKHSHTHVWYFSSWTDHHNDLLNLRKKGKQFIFHDFFALFGAFFGIFWLFFRRIPENPSIALRYSFLSFLRTWKRPIMAYWKKKGFRDHFFHKNATLGRFRVPPFSETFGTLRYRFSTFKLTCDQKRRPASPL